MFTEKKTIKNDSFTLFISLSFFLMSSSATAFSCVQILPYNISKHHNGVLDCHARYGFQPYDFSNDLDIDKLLSMLSSKKSLQVDTTNSSYHHQQQMDHTATTTAIVDHRPTQTTSQMINEPSNSSTLAAITGGGTTTRINNRRKKPQQQRKYNKKQKQNNGSDNGKASRQQLPPVIITTTASHHHQADETTSHHTDTIQQNEDGGNEKQQREIRFMAKHLSDRMLFQYLSQAQILKFITSDEEISVRCCLRDIREYMRNHNNEAPPVTHHLTCGITMGEFAVRYTRLRIYRQNLQQEKNKRRNMLDSSSPSPSPSPSSHKQHRQEDDGDGEEDDSNGNGNNTTINYDNHNHDPFATIDDRKTSIVQDQSSSELRESM